MMERRAGRPLTFDRETQTCGYLNAEGRCEVYRDRPFVCRAWGASAKMPCTFGCLPETPYLSEEAEHELFTRVIEIGGNAVVAKEQP